MDLRNRRRRQGRLVEACEHFSQRTLERVLHDLFRERTGKWRHSILQLFQLIGDVTRQKIATGRERLPELHEDGPEFFECEAKTDGARRSAIALYPGGRREIESEPERPEKMRRENDFVQPMADEHTLDLQQTL